MGSKCGIGNGKHQMKKIFPYVLIALCAGFASAQERYPLQISQAHVFEFGAPFAYRNVDRRATDVSSGLGSMYFPSKGFCYISGTDEEKFILFDKNWNQVYSTPSLSLSSLHYLESLHHVLLANEKIALDRGLCIRVFDKSDLGIPAYEDCQLGYTDGLFYLTDKVVFCSTDQGLITWELLEAGRVRFRDKEETAAWLEQGNANTYGYHRSARGLYFGSSHFGDEGTYVEYPYIANADYSAGKEWGFDVSVTPKNYMGRDTKGLFYVYSWGPDGKFFPSSDKGFYFFEIIDPWTGKVALRRLRTGQGVPKNQTPTGWGDDGLPKSVDGEGNVYFVDADLHGRRYVISKIRNSWWDELGVRGRTVGRVSDNRVRLRKEANVNSEVVDYLYENELLLIKDMSSPNVAAGNAGLWYQVAMQDGRTGWVFGPFVKLEK